LRGLGREARALPSEADRSILGRTREVAACLSAGEKERGGKGERDDGRRLLWWLGGAGGEERGQGVRGSVPHGGQNGEERGGARARQGGTAQRPASAPSRRGCGTTGAGGGERVTRRMRG
jgi:hypothetical protein